MGGAGSPGVDGWYQRRKATEYPKWWKDLMRGVDQTTCNARWASHTRNDRPWYEKDDGHFLYCLGDDGYHTWYIRTPDGHTLYRTYEADTALPLAVGWEVSPRGVAPAPWSYKAT